MISIKNILLIQHTFSGTDERPNFGLRTQKFGGEQERHGLCLT